MRDFHRQNCSDRQHNFRHSHHSTVYPFIHEKMRNNEGNFSLTNIHFESHLIGRWNAFSWPAALLTHILQRTILQIHLSNDLWKTCWARCHCSLKFLDKATSMDNFHRRNEQKKYFKFSNFFFFSRGKLTIISKNEFTHRAHRWVNHLLTAGNFWKISVLKMSSSVGLFFQRFTCWIESYLEVSGARLKLYFIGDFSTFIELVDVVNFVATKLLLNGRSNRLW